MNRAAILLVLLVLTACTSAPVATTPAEPVKVLIVGTTDVHGAFNGRSDRTKDGTVVRSGGLATFGAYVEALRAAHPGRVLVVDSGDMFQGTLESNLFEGEPMVRGYSAIGYAGAAVGNHEFDYGPVGSYSTAVNAGDDPLGALKKNAAAAAYPLLSVNMLEKATGQTPSWAKPSTLVDAGGARIGIIGVSTPDTPNVTTASNVASLEFLEPVKPVVDEAARLRAAGADAVIVIAHMGGRCTKLEDPNDLSSCETSQEVMEFLSALPPGTIDAYFGGHTHSQMRQFVAGVPTVQALPHSQAFSTVELTIDTAANRVLADRTVIRPHTQICPMVFEGTEICDTRRAPENAKLVPRTFEGRAIEPKSDVAAVLQPYLDQTTAKKNEPTGIRTGARFTRRYREESPLGDLVTDVLRMATAADVAIFNSGGIRADLRAGELVYNDFFEVSPFDNTPAVVTMTGQQLVDAIKLFAGRDRGVLQVSGIRYAFDWSRPPAERVSAVTLADGSPINPAALYRVAMPDFLATGGDGMDVIINTIPKDRVKIDQSRPFRDVMIDVLKTWPMPLAPKPLERITALNTPEDTAR